MLPGVRAVGTGRAVLPSSVSLHFQRRRQQSAQLLPPRPCTLSQVGKESLHVLLAGHVLAWASRERLLQAAPLPSTTHRPHFPPNFSHMHPCLCWGANSLCVRLLSIYSLCFGSTQTKPLSCSALPTQPYMWVEGKQLADEAAVDLLSDLGPVAIRHLASRSQRCPQHRQRCVIGPARTHHDM